MKPRRFAVLIPLYVLAGCAGGNTLRVAADSDSAAAQQVALAPAPVVDSGPRPAAPAQAAEAPVEPSGQGYAPYGGAGDLEVRRVGQWSHTGIGEARRMVIRDANGFAELWSELGAGDRPEVDFTRTVVVVAAAGERPTGGYEIAIERVARADSQLTIQVVETAPGPNCVTTGGATQPVDVVVIPGVAPRGWSFLERKEIRPCR
jgi:hypothetical protein